MYWREKARKAFTLVELLVVIGIIALLIAILMPALSRARKQALQASCGSNERQTVYGALAYANDWEEELPTMDNTWGLDGTDGVELTLGIRLPIIGFDTFTIWDWGTYADGPFDHLGGYAFMMRDYLKNDFDVVICPDGFFKRNQVMIKWDGLSGWTGIRPELLNRSGRVGYLWLAHRGITDNDPGSCWGGPSEDRDEDIARTASDLPSLLVTCDMNYFFQGPCRGQANHMASSSKAQFLVFPPNIGRREDPMKLPLGLNQARIDARVTWVPFQDWIHHRYSPFALTGGYEEWHSFGGAGL